MQNPFSCCWEVSQVGGRASSSKYVCCVPLISPCIAVSRSWVDGPKAGARRGDTRRVLQPPLRLKGPVPGDRDERGHPAFIESNTSVFTVFCFEKKLLFFITQLHRFKKITGGGEKRDKVLMS